MGNSAVSSRVLVTDPGHEIVPGVLTKDFLEAAEDAGFFWWAALLVAMLEGTIFEKWYRPHEGSTDDMLEGMKVFLGLLHQYRGQDASQEAEESNGISVKGFGYQLRAFTLILQQRPEHQAGLSSCYSTLMEKEWGETFPVGEVLMFQFWLAKFLIQKTDAVIWRPHDRKSMVSAAGYYAYLPYGSAFKGSVQTHSFPRDQFLIGFKRTIEPKYKPSGFAADLDLGPNEMYWAPGNLLPKPNPQPFRLVSMGFLMPVEEVLSLSPHFMRSQTADSFNPNRFCMQYTEILTGTGGKQFYTKNLPAADSLESVACLRTELTKLIVTNGNEWRKTTTPDIHVNFPEKQKESLLWTIRFFRKISSLRHECEWQANVSFSELGVRNELVDAALSKVMGTTCDIARVAPESLRLRPFDEKELAWLVLLAKSGSARSEEAFNCLDEFLANPAAFKLLLSSFGSDLNEGRAKVKVRVTNGAVTHIAFSPDGRAVRIEGMDFVHSGREYSYSYFPILGAEDLLVAINRGGSKTTVSVVKTPSSGVTDEQKTATKNALLVDHGITDNPFPLTEKELGDVTELLAGVNGALKGLFPEVRELQVSEVGALTGPIPGVLIFDHTQGAGGKGRKLQNGTDLNKWKDGKVLKSVPCGTGTLRIYGVATAGRAALHVHFEKT